MLGDSGRVGDAGKPEYPPIALNLVAGTQGFFKIVGKFYRGFALDVVEFAHQAYRIEIATALRIAIAKIVGQQSAPTRAETDASFGNPFSLVEKVAGLPEIARRSAVANGSGKMGMQTENGIHIEGVRSNE